MPQLVILGLVGAGAYFGLKWLSKQSRQMAEAAERAAAEAASRRKAEREPRDLGTLELDPATGSYKPRRG